MALYVYITKECEEDATEYNRHPDILRLKAKVEASQRICHFDNFPPPYLKKRFDRQIRLLADYRTITVRGQEHTVITFYRIFVRSSNEYGRFIKDTEGFGSQFLQPLVSNEELATFLEYQLEEEPLPLKSPPSDLENHFLYRFLGKDSNRGTEEFVCESARWLEVISDKKIRERLILLCKGVFDIANSKPNTLFHGINEYTIVFRWFPALNKVFLAGIARNDEEKDALLKRYEMLLAAPAESVTEEMVLQHSARAYPSELLIDEDAWMDIQRDLESNLALSPEETEVLENVHSSEGGYPIFINGRAGSGKSTILYYLFTDYVNLYLELKDQDPFLQPPLLLSCSHELRRRAEKVVGNLIKCNPHWRQETEEQPEPPTECFQEFQTFLRSLIREKDREQRFLQNKYVDYARFRRMWHLHFSKNRRGKNIGPDLSWHVIRTYIKGTNSEDYLEPEEYDCLPRKQKSVSLETFANVYEIVWESWYKGLCEQQGYWDDQDLARYVFDEDLAKPVYPAVFCDEAQDFTRVELDLIFRLCLFSNRQLEQEDIRRVPLAFAGDPFQTLNPTGFRWDSIQALYHDRLVDTLGEHVYRQIDLNYRELNLNYRSTRNIVRLCNLVQAYRAAVFDIPGLLPQQSWQTEEMSPMPVWFDRNQPEQWRQLRDEKDVTIIVPCSLNEEQDFVESDELLKSVVHIDDSGSPVNVLSPARAKGLEFGRVVLYGFTGKAPGNLLDLLDSDGKDADRLLPFEYFVNQLYVAASRPKRRLFIIENQQERNKFWKLANEEYLQQKMWKRLSKGREVWADGIGGFEIGTSESWNEDRGNPEDNAIRFEQQGMSNRDPFLLRSAAVSFENIGQGARAQKCRAYAFKFEERYVDAGECFHKAGDPQEALLCFWAAGIEHKDRILALHNTYPDIGASLEYQMVATLASPVVKTILPLMNRVLERARTDDTFRTRLAEESAFKSVIGAWAKTLANESAPTDTIRQFLVSWEQLLKLGLPPANALLAELYYRVEDYRKCIELWETTKDYATSPQYKKAKTRILAEEFSRNPQLVIPPSESKLLAEHFHSHGKYSDAMRAMRLGAKPLELVEFLGSIPDDFDDWRDLMQQAVTELAGRGEWGLIADMALLSIGNKVRNLSRKVAAVLQPNSSDLRNALLIECASNGDFPKQQSNLLMRYSDYFKRVIMESLDWTKDLTVQVVGAALERRDRQIDTLEFYELIINGRDFSKEDKRFAQARWVKTKEKQADREAASGQESSARKHASEAEDKKRSYGLYGRDIPEFPLVSNFWVKKEAAAPASRENAATEAAKAPVTIEAPGEEIPNGKGAVTGPAGATALPRSSEPPKSKTTFELGGLQFKYGRAQRRVNISHEPSMHTAKILGDVSTFESDDVEIRRHEDAYVCEAWDVECRFSGNDGLTKAELRFVALGITVSFEFMETE